ncbi:hypothetical protein EVAR_102973_1 [Eumeta japonica]|uniref:NAD(+) kinase n=1 Tax=Eumeta variegata TaxID=151549 RepID=A0A4C1UQA5_EUMVA|nr:hypothetical protein EVAR_102973_1 [Eumeta japonica]
MSERNIVNASLLYSLDERYIREHDPSVAFSIDIKTANQVPERPVTHTTIWTMWQDNEKFRYGYANSGSSFPEADLVQASADGARHQEGARRHHTRPFRAARTLAYTQIYEDAELEDLLEEDSSQTQKELALTVEVTQQAVSRRLKSLGMIHKQDNWVPYELKPRDVERRLYEKHMVVFVEAAVLEDSLLANYGDFNSVRERLMTFRAGTDDLTDKIDFIVCLGGDGTLLHASSLFQQSVPPVMAFHLGSLGFLTPFEFSNFQEQVMNVLEGHAALTLRSRLQCVVLRKSQDESKDKKKPTTILVLNEVVVDRGPSPYLSNIDLFLDGKHITSVQGDGLIVSTPTGSTAYAVAAGASMIHPSVPAIMVTPICPHSLSFRPIVVPAGVELKIMPNLEARSPASVSFDGLSQLMLKPGDSLYVTTSVYPVPSICAQDQISDWFDSLAECLHWNVRKKQKQMDELSDLTHSSTDTLDDCENHHDDAAVADT